ncbi:sensor histidine kinase [Acetivibrio mesophilus]|uniref:histidine kinase n=1 Tax=Acetivibrio mesophilus TaxID=2487273 RepID=A0A4V1K224_9FIRM|nr:cache domain-containing protein [Acetivibrio mesophilus]ODM27365.1 hypothetical protein A7W90_14700 [Clostridium sp. Bc-iso-3]RXE58799.1 hypothetical protein EFD62_10055 [Acetivibrio mesophilus]HHV28969.1 hypothetical protein [Clostridium sp.]
MKKFIEANNSLLIRNLIVLLFILLNVAFVFISIIITNNRFEVLLEQSMTQQLAVVEDFFRYPENIINILSQNKDLSMYEEKDRFLRADILSLFESVIVPDSRISNIYYVPMDKEVISYKFIDSNTDLTDKSWFKKALEAKTPFTWVSHKSDFTNDDVISCLKKVVDKYNNPIGVIGLDIELFKLSKLVKDVKIANNGYFMILDAENKIIATPDNKYLGHSIQDNNLNNAINNYSKRSFISKISGQKSKCIVYQLEELPWKIINTIPASEITYSIISYVFLFFFFSMASLVIAFMMYSKNRITENSNRELKNANEKLKEYASTVEEIAVLRERNRLARDVHDTLGQTLSILITLLQLSLMSCKKDIKETEENLKNAIKITGQGLNEVRRSISGLVPEKLEQNNLFDALEKLINDFECLGMKVELSVNKFDKSVDTEYKETIYRICQEALTNSVKHGRATKATIIIKFTDSCIKLFIFDDGIGCKRKSEGKGFGLQGMKQRVQKLKGEIKFGSGDQNGFNIHVEIPIEKSEQGSVSVYDKSCVS